MIALATIHLCATWFMVGLIWMVQTVHYPLFALVGGQSFVSYEIEHTQRIGRLLVVPAAVEAAAAMGLLWMRPDGVAAWPVMLSAVLLGVLWLMTLLVHVPLHRRLSRAWSARALDRLVISNWLRTVGWSLRGVLSLLILAQTI